MNLEKIPSNNKDYTAAQLENIEKLRRGKVDPEELRRKSLEKIFKGNVPSEVIKPKTPGINKEISKVEKPLTLEERAKINLAKYKEGKIQGKSIEQLKSETIEKLKNPSGFNN